MIENVYCLWNAYEGYFRLCGKRSQQRYCVYCSRPDGEMQSFEEKKESLTKFIVKTQGADENVAWKIAENMMHKLPAWKEYFN